MIRAILSILLLLAVAGHRSFVTASQEPQKSGRRLKGGRKLSTTIFAWQQFESNWRTRGKTDSSDDEEKRCAKMRDKYGITCAPSSVPSSTPSVSPTVSYAPSMSAQPTNQPSVSPTKAPSPMPSKSPTGQPSVSPTKAPTDMPSVSPTNVPTTLSPTVTPFASLVLTREDGSLWQDNTCQTSIPARATEPQTEATLFEYFLLVKPNSNADASVQIVEQELATSLAQQVLTCVFAEQTTTTTSVNRNSFNDAPFETFAVSSLPGDKRSEDSCPEDVVQEGVDCYRISAGFTPTIFYLESQRQRHRDLAFLPGRSFSTQSVSEIVQYFGPILQNLLDSDSFVSGDVLGTQYSGFLERTGGGGASGTDVTFGSVPTGTVGDITSGATSAIQGGAWNGNGNPDEENPGYIIGAVVVCLAAVALLVVGAVLIQRRKEATFQRDFEKCDSSGEFDVEVDTDGEKHENENLQEGFPTDNTRYVHSRNHNNNATAIAMPNVDNESIQTGSVATGKYTPTGSVATGKYSQTSGDARRSLRGLRYGLADDEATYDESMLGLDSSAGNDPHDYTNCKSETCFKCRSRNLPQPTFLKADLHAIQSDLGSSKKYKPKYDRTYIADDTVDL